LQLHIGIGTKSGDFAQLGVSKNVKEALNTLDEIKQAGGTVKINPMNPNQELNMTIQGGGQKLDFRIETHKLPALRSVLKKT
jgi:hypothetical protein